MRKLLIITTALLALPAWATQIYTCTDSKGRKTFSQQPCSPKAKATTISGPEMLGSVSTDAKTTDRISSNNRLRTVNILIDRKENEIDSFNADMSRELEYLRNQRAHASNNLAGATWEQSLAGEMQATAEKYKVKVSVAQSELTSLRDEKRRLTESINK